MCKATHFISIWFKETDFGAVCLQNGIPFSKSCLKIAFCLKRVLYSSQVVRQEQRQGPPIPNPEEKVPKISQLAENRIFPQNERPQANENSVKASSEGDFGTALPSRARPIFNLSPHSVPISSQG